MSETQIIVMGVSGCGKSTIGRALADQLRRAFIEGDDFHPSANIAKMTAGQALQNADRKAWIDSLCHAANATGPSVIACSALNATVRGWLKAGLRLNPHYIWLHGSEALLADRLARRADHFFDPALLTSQFVALNAPADAISISVDQSVEDILEQALAALDKNR